MEERERQAGQGKGEGKKPLMSAHRSLNAYAAEQAPNVGRGPARPGQSLRRSLVRPDINIGGRANTLIAMSSDVGKPTNPSTM
jgi:hypothetical protein